MTSLHTLWFWPSVGFPNGPWLDNPDEDAFVRSARSVCELYSEAVAEAHIPARHSELRLFCELDPDRADVLVTVFPEFRDGFEMANVVIPSGVADRALLVLEVVHAAATRLGRDRGWDLSALAGAHAHALAAGLRYRWTGPSKTSPDRRHTARPVFVLLDDGWGRVVIEIRRRSDDHLVTRSRPARTFGTSVGFRRAARALRWRGSCAVELDPWGDGQDALRLELHDPAEPVEAFPGGAGDLAALPAISVQTPDNRGPHIRASAAVR